MCARFFLIVAVVLSLGLTGCPAQKQIVEPMNVGFTPDEFVLASYLDDKALGSVYFTLTEDTSDIVLNNMNKYKWHKMPIKLEETSSCQEIVFTQRRELLSEVRLDGRVGSPMINVSTNYDMLFKCDTRIDKVKYFNFESNENIMLSRLAELHAQNSRYHFSYLSTLYKGNSVITAHKKLDNNLGFGMTVLSLDGKLYSSDGSKTDVQGNVVYKLEYIILHQMNDGRVAATVPARVNGEQMLIQGVSNTRSE